jgi:predicted NBD/HSP70 family sugar kinase
VILLIVITHLIATPILKISGITKMTSFANSTVLDLRRANRQKILRLIYFARSITRPVLAQQSGLSVGTVATVVTELLEEGILLELGMEDSQGGRPRAILSLNASFGYFIGVDIGETHICLELFDLTLAKLAAVQIPIQESEANPTQVVKYISQAFKILLERGKIGAEQVIGIGIGVPGVVDREQPHNIQVIAPIWGWESAPLYAMTKKELPVPLYIDNAAKAMTQAEAWFRVGKPIETMVSLLIGTGVGGGIIQQGVLYRGPTNSAGELGHNIIEYKGRLCRCGSRGCLEAYVGAPGIIERIRELQPKHSALRPNGQKQIIDALLEAAQAGDPVAQQVLQDTSHYLGAAMINIVNTFNPQLITLGGWTGIKIGPYILNELEQVVKEHALKPATKNLKIELAQFGEDAINMGAATLALDDFLTNSTRWDNQRSKKAEKLSSVS